MTRHHDIEVLNRCLAGEYFGIAAYDAAVGSGLLDDEAVVVARAFQGDHRAHAAEIESAIREVGGTPIERRAWADYAREFPPPPLQSGEDVLRYAASLEHSAAAADVDALRELKSADLRALIARIAAVEAMHLATLRSALGQPAVPASLLPLTV